MAYRFYPPNPNCQLPTVWSTANRQLPTVRQVKKKTEKGADLTPSFGANFKKKQKKQKKNESHSTNNSTNPK